MGNMHIKNLCSCYFYNKDTNMKLLLRMKSMRKHISLLLTFSSYFIHNSFCVKFQYSKVFVFLLPMLTNKVK